MSLRIYNQKQITSKEADTLSQVKQCELLKTSNAEKYLLARRCPNSTDSREVFLLKGARFINTKGEWFKLPKKYKSNQLEELIIVLSMKESNKLRTLATNKMNIFMGSPGSLFSTFLARKIVHDVCSGAAIEELEKVNSGSSSYLSVRIDNMFSGWLDFNVNNDHHRNIACAMKYVILSYTGMFSLED